MSSSEMREPTFLVLAALADGRKHGYAVITEVAGLSSGRVTLRPGTLYAAMTSRARSQDVLLPLVHYPLVVPVLLASVPAIDLILNGDPMGQLGSWAALLVGFALVYWSVGGVLFPLAIEE